MKDAVVFHLHSFQFDFQRGAPPTLASLWARGNRKTKSWWTEATQKALSSCFYFSRNKHRKVLSNSSGCVINTVVRNIVHTRYWPDAVIKPFCGSYNLDVERFVSCPVIETQLQRLSFMLGLSPCVKSARWVWVVKDILTLLTAHINLKVPEDGSVLFNADVWKVKQNN